MYMRLGVCSAVHQSLTLPSDWSTADNWENVRDVSNVATDTEFRLIGQADTDMNSGRFT